MVLGDLMLDTYTIGKARRISPEAPVAVVNVQREEHRPGGAGNVILNLISMGAKVVAIGRTGQDSAGMLLRNALTEEKADISGVYVQDGFPTPVKNRILAENQQIVRVDHEITMPISEELEQRIIKSLPSLLKEVQVIAISDYGKGFLSQRLLQAVISAAQKQRIPVISDPKGTNFAKYNGSTILKPNLGEAYAAANMPLDAPLDKVAAAILTNVQAEYLMVTRSEAGISLFHQNGEHHNFPVRKREVKDVTGAGDTVLAMLSCAIANGLPMTTAVQLANVAAGIAIERFGCARVTLSQLARRLLEEDVGNKIFDREHLFALQEVLRGNKFILLSISGSQGLTSAIFSSIRQMGTQNDLDLLVHIRDANPDPGFVDLLASLHDVDFIILKDSLKSLSDKVRPEEIYSIDQNLCKRIPSFDSLL